MNNETKVQAALTLIKRNITEQELPVNRDLHNAVQLLVDVLREHGYCQK